MIKLKDLLEGKNYNSPGYENRQFGDPLPTLEDITRKYQEGKESVDENILKQIQQAEKIAKSMAGNMTGAVKGIEKIRRGLSHHKRVKVALKKYNESVNESISVFDVDFYKDNSSEQTSHKEIIKGDKFFDVISKTTKVAKSKKMNYVELYYKGAFIGSIDKRNSFKFKKGRNHQKSPLSVTEETINEAPQPEQQMASQLNKVSDTILKITDKFKGKADVDGMTRSWMMGLHARLKKAGIKS